MLRRLLRVVSLPSFRDDLSFALSDFYFEQLCGLLLENPLQPRKCS